MAFAELFTQSVREVLPLARARNLVTYFDYRGPELELPPGDAALRSGIYRVLRAVIDCLDVGFVTFSADVASVGAGTSRVLIRAAGTGVANPEVVQEVVRRLLLVPVTSSALGSVEKASRYEGICPTTGGQVSLMDDRTEGLLLCLEMELKALEVSAASLLPDAAGVTAWLVSEGLGGLDSVSRRLQRQGWRVQLFDSLAQMSAVMADVQTGGAQPPSLWMVAEWSGGDLPEMERIAGSLPSMWTVLGVVAGSATVLRRGSTAVDIRVLPLSPQELDHMTAHVDWRSSTAVSRETSPRPLFVQDRKLILVVDDSEINQVLADAMLDVLGYDVVIAHDGIEALAVCQRDPPDAVLMDIEMPLLGGLAATERLRALQRDGGLPPFAIVAATSGAESFPRQVCLDAGMDGYLVKPLVLEQLADELHRVLPSRPAALDEDQTRRPSR